MNFFQNNSSISSAIKQENLEIVLKTVVELSKKSLKVSNYNVQYDLLNIIDELTRIPSEIIVIEMMKILLYFIMIPTSKYSLIAINKCFNLARRNSTTTTSIYNQNKREYCEVIAKLCCVNEVLINYNLVTSLEKVSLMLGFYGSKEFVMHECNYLLPFFISNIVKIPTVTQLIEEMALLMQIELSEMLSCKYGYIFIHIFLEKIDEFKQCMMYLERTSGLTGPTLRKKNFRVGLLNFTSFSDKKY